MEPAAEQAAPRLQGVRMDKRVGVFGSLDHNDEFTFWRTRDPDERLAAIELLRQINYGDLAATARLQRVFEYAELPMGCGE